jgi:hypothetical protein
VTRWLAFVLVLLAFGCSRLGTDDDAGTGLTLDELAAFNAGAPGALGVITLAEAAETMFALSGTIDPAQSDVQNAQLVQTHAQANLVACGNVALSGNTVTANFGAPPGCHLTSGGTISGTIAVAVTKTGTNVNISLMFTAVVINTQTLSGGVTFVTTDGAGFSITGSFTVNGTKFAPGITLTGAAGAVTIDGSLSITGTSTTSLTFTAVEWKSGDCYPDAGALSVDKSAVSVTVTFSASTPSTGAVEVTVGKKTSAQTLPTYGNCGAIDAG